MSVAELLWAERCVLRVPKLYARGVDRRDWDLVRSCFAADAFVDGSRDALAIDTYLEERLRPGVEFFPATMHFIGNQIADIDSGAQTGRVETYAVAYHFKVEPAGVEHPDNIIVGVRYHDEMVFSEGDWRIARRRVSGDWRQGPYPDLG